MGRTIRTQRPASGSVNIRSRRFAASKSRAEGTYWGVFIGANMQGRWCAKRKTAEELAEKINTARRPCLCCGSVFLSEGAHNRMCDPCRRRAASGDYL